jgi:hypothetical protein
MFVLGIAGAINKKTLLEMASVENYDKILKKLMKNHVTRNNKKFHR